ncbi:ATP-binding cassette sub-family C member 5-like [Lampetra planeri]
MTLLEGSVAVSGTLAYVAQQAWILNTTVRDNILFGKAYNEERYNMVLEACCLRIDLAMLPYGDMTEIGERGANLSGGQRQRISLARALYSDRSIYLLDDPLSAVDNHVGAHLFTHAIRTGMRGKTVMFVTHQLQYLAECDVVLFMRDGCMAEWGTHAELMNNSGDYALRIPSSDPRKPSGAREDPSWGRGRTPRGAAGGHLVGPRRVTGGFTAAVVVAEGERSEGHSRSHSVLRSDGCGSTTFTNVR